MSNKQLYTCSIFKNNFMHQSSYRTTSFNLHHLFITSSFIRINSCIIISLISKIDFYSLAAQPNLMMKHRGTPGDI